MEVRFRDQVVSGDGQTQSSGEAAAWESLKSWTKGQNYYWYAWELAACCKVQVQVCPAGLIGITRQLINSGFLQEPLFYFLPCSCLWQKNVSDRFFCSFKKIFHFSGRFCLTKHQECLFCLFFLLLLHPFLSLDGGSRSVSALLFLSMLKTCWPFPLLVCCPCDSYLMWSGDWNEAGPTSFCWRVGKNSSTHECQLLFQFYFNLPVYD